MKTAVEFLVEEVFGTILIGNHLLKKIQQAKEMEKEQIIDACKQCSYSYEEAEQYYNETFKTK